MEKHVEAVEIGKIKPYGKNPRVNDGAVDSVAESIKEFGFNVPMVIDKDFVIICGHARYKAAQKLGLKEVPCIIADHLTKKQAQAFRIADNKTSDFSFFDNKLLLEELGEIGGEFFTGFDFGFGELESGVLDEKDNDVITGAEDGVTYEAVFRSEDKEKIDKIKAYWDAMENE